MIFSDFHSKRYQFGRQNFTIGICILRSAGSYEELCISYQVMIHIQNLVSTFLRPWKDHITQPGASPG